MAPDDQPMPYIRIEGPPGAVIKAGETVAVDIVPSDTRTRDAFTLAAALLMDAWWTRRILRRPPTPPK